jgi:hypothetical protein
MAIRDQIDLIIHSQPDSDVTTELANFLFGQLYSDPHRDAASALIILMAKNLKSLKVCKQCADITEFFQFPWTAENESLQKLTSFSTCSCEEDHSLPLYAILPNTEHLKTKGWAFALRYDYPHTITYPKFKPTNAALQSIQVVSVQHSPTFFAKLVQSAWMANLKRLEVQNNISHGNTENWDMPALFRSLELYTPKLEVFEWTNCCNVLDAPGLYIDTFQGLPNLKEIKVDFDHIAPSQSFSDIVRDTHKLFPNHLESLTINKVDALTMNKDVKALVELIKGGMHNDTVLAKAAKTMAGKSR